MVGAGAVAGAAGCVGAVPVGAVAPGAGAFGAGAGAGRRVSRARCWFTLRTVPPLVEVSMCEPSDNTTKPIAKPQVSFSSRSPVRFTPIMLAAPPVLNWLEIPPPLGFWASTTRASRKHTMRMRMTIAVYIRSKKRQKAT